MHVQWRDFAGGREAFPFVKWGCDSITMEFIHPHSRPRGEGGDRGEDRWRESERGWWEKSLFSLLRSLPLFISFHSAVYRNQGGARWISVEFRYRGRFFPGWSGRRKFSARPTNILSIDLRKILDFHIYIYTQQRLKLIWKWLGLSWLTNLYRRVLEKIRRVIDPLTRSKAFVWRGWVSRANIY